MVTCRDIISHHLRILQNVIYLENSPPTAVLQVNFSLLLILFHLETLMSFHVYLKLSVCIVEKKCIWGTNHLASDIHQELEAVDEVTSYSPFSFSWICSSLDFNHAIRHLYEQKYAVLPEGRLKKYFSPAGAKQLLQHLVFLLFIIYSIWALNLFFFRIEPRKDTTFPTLSGFYSLYIAGC